MNNQIDPAQFMQALDSDNPMQERYCGKVSDEFILAADTVFKEVVQKVLDENNSSSRPALFIP